MQLPDAVGDEERPRPAEEPDRGGGPLILESLGVGQAGEAIHGRVQVGVADFRPGPALGLLRRLTAAAVGASSAAVGDRAHLLHIEVDHVSGPGGADASRGPAGVLSLRGEVAQPGDSESVLPAADGAQTDRHGAVGQVAVDASGGPFVLAPEGLD